MHLRLGPSSPALREIATAAERHAGGQLRVIVAWAREGGVCHFVDAIDAYDLRLNMIIGINDRGTTVEALLRLQRESESLSVFYKHPRQTFHPKIYWFQGGRSAANVSSLIVGSSNLTVGGLITNFEASLVTELGNEGEPSDEDVLRCVDAIWNELAGSPFTHTISGPDDIRRLYESGYVAFERTILAESRRARRRPSPTGGLPTAPLPRIQPPDAARLAIPFQPGPRDMPQVPDRPDADPVGEPPFADRFFVRTLTPNDVAKLQGRTPGTFEPDLGQTARDRYPAFWGWPDNYDEIVRQLPRLEWDAGGRLFTSLTPRDGVAVQVMLWYREARPAHAAEHRIGLRPIGLIRESVPADFDGRSLMVVERATEDLDYDFVVRLITTTDAGYGDFVAYLTEERPQHRYGYGPQLLPLQDD